MISPNKAVYVMAEYNVLFQNRIHAGSADEAAMMLREKYGTGRLTLKHVFDDWYEFTIVLKSGVICDAPSAHKLPDAAGK